MSRQFIRNYSKWWCMEAIKHALEMLRYAAVYKSKIDINIDY